MKLEWLQRFNLSSCQSSHILSPNLLSLQNSAEDLFCKLNSELKTSCKVRKKCNLFITIEDTKWNCVFNHYSVTLPHLSLSARTRFSSYKKRANPLSVFAMRARTSAMSVRVAAGGFNLAYKPQRTNRQNYQTYLWTSSIPRGMGRWWKLK